MSNKIYFHFSLLHFRARKKIVTHTHGKTKMKTTGLLLLPCSQKGERLGRREGDRGVERDIRVGEDGNIRRAREARDEGGQHGE